jgi:hypothetical protein
VQCPEVAPDGMTRGPHPAVWQREVDQAHLELLELISRDKEIDILKAQCPVIPADASLFFWRSLGRERAEERIGLSQPTIPPPHGDWPSIPTLAPICRTAASVRARASSS